MSTTTTRTCPGCLQVTTLTDTTCDCTMRGRCDHPSCGEWLTLGETFTHKGWNFCLHCISALVSWMQDGGEQDDPGMFAYLTAGVTAPT